MTLCEVCGRNESFAVLSVPGVPYSAAYCLDCYKAGAHPWDILVINTACCNGLEHMVEEWHQMVETTCNYLHRSLDEFKRQVDDAMQDMDGADL